MVEWKTFSIDNSKMISKSLAVLKCKHVKIKYATSHFNSYNSRRYNALQKYKTLIG